MARFPLNLRHGLPILVSTGLHLAVAGTLFSHSMQPAPNAGQPKTVTMMVLAQAASTTPQPALPQPILPRPVRHSPPTAAKPEPLPATAPVPQQTSVAQTQTASSPITDMPAQEDPQSPAGDDPHWHQPLFKAAPDYPDKAMARGIEGDCSVRFEVSAEGTVGEPQAMADCHPLFVRASLQAARAFRYQPLPTHLPTQTRQVVNTFHYRIE